MRGAVLVGGLLYLAVGCAPSQVQRIDGRDYSEWVMRTSRVGHDYSLEPVLGTTTPSVRLLRAPTCRTDRARQVRRQTEVRRTASKHLGTVGLTAVLSLLAGTASLATAGEYPEMTTDPDALTRSDVETGGAVLVATGVISTIWAAGIGISARDSVEYGDWSVQRRSGEVGECGDSKPVGQQVVRLEAGGQVVNGLTDGNGVATFSLPIEFGKLSAGQASSATVTHRKTAIPLRVDLTQYAAYDDAVRRERARAEAEARAKEERRRQLEAQRAAAQAAERRRAEKEAQRRHAEQLERLTSLGAQEIEPELRISPDEVSYRLDLQDEEVLEILPADSPVWVVARAGTALGFVYAAEDESPAYEDLVDVHGWTSDRLLSPSEYERHLRRTRISATTAASVEANYFAFKWLLELDVLRFYDLASTHDTPLKEKKFRQSDEYRRLRGELRNIRKKFRTATSFIRISGVDIPEYDLKRRRFALLIGSNTEAIPPECFAGFCFDGLSIQKDKIAYRGKSTGLVRYTWLVHANEDEALAMENQSVDIYFLFSPVETKTRRVRYHDGLKLRTTKEEVITTKNVRIVMTLRDEDTIIWQRDL